MCIFKEYDFRLVSTGTYYLVPAPIFVQKSPGLWTGTTWTQALNLRTLRLVYVSIDFLILMWLCINIMLQHNCL